MFINSRRLLRTPGIFLGSGFMDGQGCSYMPRWARSAVSICSKLHFLFQSAIDPWTAQASTARPNYTCNFFLIKHQLLFWSVVGNLWVQRADYSNVQIFNCKEVGAHSPCVFQVICNFFSKTFNTKFYCHFSKPTFFYSNNL